MQNFAFRYPYLARGTVVDLSRRGGTLSSDAHPAPLRVGPATARVVAGLDGLATWEQLVESLYRGAAGDEELLGAAAELMALFREGLLVFASGPHPEPAAIRGSLEIDYPENLEVELTAACNLRCSYCYRDALYGREKGRLTTASLLSILASLRDRGLRSVELTGGEPLTHPDFARIAEFCLENFALVGLLTNGTLMDERRIQPLLAHKAKLVISVSIDSARPEMHDRRRGQTGAFARTTAAIRLLAANGLRTRVSMSVDEENWPEIEPTLLLARSLGASAFTYSPILPLGRGKGNFQFWSTAALGVLQAEKILQENYRDFLDLLDETTVARVQTPGGCGAGHRVYAMDPHGNVRPCVTFGLDQAVFGCLARQTPEEVFGGTMPRRFAELVPPNEQTCGSCQWSTFCRSCMYRGLVAAGWIGNGNCRWLAQPPAQEWRKLVN
jgi:radical SAM protein with 4Fe4S-binding SPASM domain